MTYQNSINNAILKLEKSNLPISVASVKAHLDENVPLPILFKAITNYKNSNTKSDMKQAENNNCQQIHNNTTSEDYLKLCLQELKSINTYLANLDQRLSIIEQTLAQKKLQE